MSIYADKKPKPSIKNSRKKSSSSIYYDLPSKTSQKPFWLEDNKTLKDGTDSKSSDDIMKYWMKKYRELVHYNSPEPERYGARAFTKNSEIYIAPGEESALPHELAHVYQQKTQNIPATGKINGEKVNTDSKLEKEADEISKNIGGYIPRVIISGKKQVNSNNVMQFAPPSKKTYQLIKRISKNIGSYVSKVIISGKKQDAANDIVQFVPPSKETYQLIKRISKDCGIPDGVMTDEKVNDIFRKYEENLDNYLFHREYRDCPECLLLDEIKNDPECQLYLNLNSSRPQWTNFNEGENQRILGITDMLSTEKIFEHSDGEKVPLHTLHEIIVNLEDEQIKILQDCILRLKKVCDREGIKSVLQSADKNDAYVLIDFRETEKERLDRPIDYFIKRLKLITSYIEKVATKKDADEKTFGEKYWIRSTGSDLHKNGEHALFLVNKKNQEGYKNDSRKRAGEIAKVYKPHDLSADNAVVGKEGIFSQVNYIIKEDFNGKLKELGLIEGSEEEDIFATMDIDVEDHTEEFVTKKSEMTPGEAKKYFFRAGMLKVITDAMAVIDLHQDNIMPTLNGPMIIDAEIDFFQYIDSFLESSALSKDEHNGRITNSSFNIEGEIKRSGELFKNNDLEYYKNYEKGYNFMLNQMYENKDRFAQIYTNNLERVDKVRIIPLATEVFAGILKSAITSGIQEESLSILLGDIKKELQEDQFIFSEKNNMGVNVFENKLKEAIEKTFDDGTIIAMYVDTKGKIYLGDTEVGQIVKKSGEEIATTGEQKKEKMIEMMKKSFLKVIKQLYNNSLEELSDKSDLS